jgi:IS4 transposase
VLQLLLTWAVAERSLRETAALAAEAEMADISDVALLKRFRRAEGWLGGLLGEYLLGRSGQWKGAYRVRVLDASAVNRPGKHQSDLRLHVGLDLATQRIDSMELTDVRGGESLERFGVRTNEIVIADRGYAHRSGLTHVVKAGGSFIVRIPWNNVPLENRQGERFDIPAELEQIDDAQPAAFAVQFRSADGQTVPCRLVAVRKSEPAAERARAKAAAERSKHGSIDIRTLQTAGYVFVLTNLGDEISAASVLDLYRLRWQIEMKFKTLKSVLHLGHLPARSESLARVYVMAKVLVALAIEDLVEQAESFSPWGYPLATD